MWIKNKGLLRFASLLFALLLFALPLPLSAASAHVSADPIACAAGIEEPFAARLSAIGTSTDRRPSKGHTPMPLPAATGEVRLLPGGMPFGVRMQTKGVMVVGLSEVISGKKSKSPAKEGGVREKDILIAVNGQAVTTAEEATAAIRAAGVSPIRLTVLRDGEKKELNVRPLRCDKDGAYRLGLYLRDSASGIGTVTFLDPESGLFGGLGHGVCDADTGALVPLSRGSVLPVRITGVEQGKVGHPGELRGSLGISRIGALVTNNECGVFGVLTDPPVTDREALPICPSAEVKEGDATLLCTLGDDGIREYRITLSAIERGDRPTRSFTIHVTDPDLLARTGGIVQGMSGSPILQNGRIVGAVTHVLVDDPTSGYGIFIENMLSAMQMRAVA